MRTLVTIAILLGLAVPAAAQTADRLYVMDCGHNSAKDQSRWSPGVNVGKPIEHLLILDDLAYVTKDQAETSVLFELISARYERRSLLITANQPFGEWGKVFPDAAMTVAVIDRLVHHADVADGAVSEPTKTRQRRTRSRSDTPHLSRSRHQKRKLNRRALWQQELSRKNQHEPRTKMVEVEKSGLLAARMPRGSVPRASADPAVIKFDRMSVLSPAPAAKGQPGGHTIAGPQPS
jgi:hypothetical protein